MKKTVVFIMALLLLAIAITSCKPSDGTQTDTEPHTGAQTGAKVTKLTINGKEQDLDDFTIEYTLCVDEVKIPVVAAEKSEGEGELIIEQATTIPGTATVTLNEVKYMITFQSDFIYEKSVLQNTYHKLMSQEKLKVAYIGGSVTVGAFGDAGKSYRDLTTKWFRDHFDAKIVETNAGIGGTGSFWGSYRITEHLNLDSKTACPDLVFIEFAVNDYYDGTTPENIKNYAESMIRTVYGANPYADIIILIVGEQTTVGENSDKTNAWREVAAHYELPIVELTESLLADMRENGKPWSYYIADVVHPNNNGYAMYASYIAELLQAELIDKMVSPFISNEKKLPATRLGTKELCDLSYHEVYQLSLPASSGFRAYNTTDETGRGLSANDVGASMHFSFYGTGVVLSLGSKDGIVLEYTIDGKPYEDIHVSKDNSPILAEGLEEGTHTVSIRIKERTSGILYIKRILVQGNTQREGIRIVAG